MIEMAKEKSAGPWLGGVPTRRFSPIISFLQNTLIEELQTTQWQIQR